MKYKRPRDLGIVVSYFNPCGFRTRRANFDRFVEPILASGIPLVIVEARFEGDDAPLPDKYDVIRVNARDVMWQKERLLDLGTGWLPEHVTKVAWLDADILFESEDWAVETSERLETAMVLQPFADVIRLDRDASTSDPRGDVFQSFGAVFETTPEVLKLAKFELHGHTGFAWAARRDFLAQHGFYDACIAGSGDHMMAHTFAGDWESPCIYRIAGKWGRHIAHFRRWSERIHAAVGGRLSYTPGRLLHLWHGTIENRRYAQRNQELLELSFDPRADIRISDTGCWEWATEKPDLHDWARRYFVERREDDDSL